MAPVAFKGKRGDQCGHSLLSSLLPLHSPPPVSPQSQPLLAPAERTTRRDTKNHELLGPLESTVSGETPPLQLLEL
ncbi:hypothetical protein MHYP_G00083390 [Metynnis hypsauchen]